jgi:hypothetical protein
MWLHMPSASKSLRTISFAEADTRTGHQDELTRMTSSHVSLRNHMEVSCISSTIDSRIDSKAVEMG